ncbi:MAG: dephospho-CoA kinase, partial [Candidatus Kapaibacteriota bacterium]
MNPLLILSKQYMKKILLVGITGNFGAGKTTVAKILETEGCPVIYSDDLAKRLMRYDKRVQEKLKKAFGNEVYQSDGDLNSKYLAEKVFSTAPDAEQNLILLNSIVHPFVLSEAEKIINELIKEGHNLIFFESALIYEANIENLFDYIILVVSDTDKITERLVSAGKFTPNEVVRRLEKQIPQEEKRKLADFTIVNNGSIEELQKNVQFIL